MSKRHHRDKDADGLLSEKDAKGMAAMFAAMFGKRHRKRKVKPVFEGDATLMKPVLTDEQVERDHAKNAHSHGARRNG